PRRVFCGRAVVKIELFGIARARAGREELRVRAKSLAEALRALEDACPALAPEVISGGKLAEAYVASLNGERFLSHPDAPLRDGDALLILGAQSGG
ncbi:MAG: MoaD/ThiS family protein, partial [Planctomycetota bacterium]